MSDIKTRKVVHVGVTRAPTEQWTAQQLRNITPFGEGPDAIIRDRDSKFGTEFDRVEPQATHVGEGLRYSAGDRFAPFLPGMCVDGLRRRSEEVQRRLGLGRQPARSA